MEYNDKVRAAAWPARRIPGERRRRSTAEAPFQGPQDHLLRRLQKERPRAVLIQKSKVRIEPGERRVPKKSYSDNFRFGRIGSWTH